WIALDPSPAKKRAERLALGPTAKDDRSLALEIEAERQLHLSVGPDTDGSGNSLGRLAPRACHRGRERLTGLELVGLARGVAGQWIWQGASDARKVGLVEDVEDLKAQLAARTSRRTNPFRNHRVHLGEIGPVDLVAG